MILLGNSQMGSDILLSLFEENRLDDLIVTLKETDTIQSEDDFIQILRMTEKLRLQGEISVSLEILDIIENQMDNEVSISLKIDHSIQKIYCLWRLFDNYSALHLSILTLELLEKEKENNPHYTSQLAFLHHLRGNVFAALGEYSLGIKTHKLSLDLYQKIGNLEKVALLSNNIGFNISLVGEIAEAEKYLTSALDYYQGTDLYQDTARVLNNLGMLRFHTGEFEDARYYFVEAIKMQQMDPNPHEISYSYLEIIKLLVMMGDITSANSYLSKFEELKDNCEYEIINLRYNLSKAIVYKTHKRFECKATAVKILKDVLASETLHHRYVITALKYLAELKFEELEIFEDLTILEEIEELIGHLQDEGALQESIVAQAETDLLLSKVYLIKGEFELARQCLYKAQLATEESGLKYIAMNISNLYDELLDQLSFWEQDNIDQEPIMERIGKANIFSFLRDIQRNRLEIKVKSKEEAVLFLILNDIGNVKATVKFSGFPDLQEYLIANLISAISSFFQSTFAESDKIERIKSKEYTLILKTEGKYTYCYICKGQSYYAIKKLDKIVSNLQSNQEFHEIRIKWEKKIDRVFELPANILETIENTLLKEISQ